MAVSFHRFFIARALAKRASSSESSTQGLPTPLTTTPAPPAAPANPPAPVKPPAAQGNTANPPAPVKPPAAQGNTANPPATSPGVGTPAAGKDVVVSGEGAGTQTEGGSAAQASSMPQEDQTWGQQVAQVAQNLPALWRLAQNAPKLAQDIREIGQQVGIEINSLDELPEFVATLKAKLPQSELTKGMLWLGQKLDGLGPGKWPIVAAGLVLLFNSLRNSSAVESLIPAALAGAGIAWPHVAGLFSSDKAAPDAANQTSPGVTPTM